MRELLEEFLWTGHTAFHFLDKSGLKRNRQIRLIRYIDYPMYYYLAHVSKGVVPNPSLSPNGKNNSDTELVQRKKKIAECGPKLKDASTELVSASKETARNQLIPAELQVNYFMNAELTNAKSHYLISHVTLL